MAKNNNKTTSHSASVADFIEGITDPVKKSDCKKVRQIMQKATGKRARMWGSSIVGFGEYHYRYESGREGDSFLTGFSPRAQSLSVYIMPGFKDYAAQLKRLGKHKLGKSCLYIKRLDDVDVDVLTEIINDSVRVMNARYHGNK